MPVNRIKAGLCPKCGQQLQQGSREFKNEVEGTITFESFLWCPNRSCDFKSIYLRGSRFIDG